MPFGTGALTSMSCEQTEQFVPLIAGQVSSSRRGWVLFEFFKRLLISLFYYFGIFRMAEKGNMDPSVPPQPLWESSVVHSSYLFIKKEAKFSNKFGWSCYYRCSKFRAGCTASLIHRDSTSTVEIPNGIHTCPIAKIEKRKLDSILVHNVGILDLTAEMKIKIELLSVTDMKPARLLAESISEDFELLYTGQIVKCLTRDQIRKLILKFRNEEFGNWRAVISSPPLCFSSDGDERLFLQFNHSLNVDDELVNFIGWANPDLIFLLRCIKSNLFIDCTFYIVPKGFSQCMIIMVYHPVTKLYLPVFFILLQSAKYEVYFHAIGAAIGQCDFMCEGLTVTLDYEQGLIKAVTEQFPDADKVLCLFHWKQAIRRKLLSFHIPKNVVSLLMGHDGLINILPIVEIVDIPKAIQYIRAHFAEGSYQEHFSKFWRYFENTWCKKYDPTDWNISVLMKKDNVAEIFVGRFF